MIREIAAGLVAASLVFAALNGVNLWPLLVLGAALVAVRLLAADGKLLGRRFGVVEGGAEGSNVTFDDIGGHEMAKRELIEALEFVRDAEKVKQLGIRPLRGILLAGPPGTGKTMMARAAAGYTDAAFLVASGSQFVEMYAGVGAQRVRELFRKARALARERKSRTAVIFIDELEVLGGQRGRHTSHLEYDQTLNQLLVEMDGMVRTPDVQVLVIGATNRMDLLDSALMRPGRFDRIVRVDLPDREARLQILKIHCRHRPLAPDVDLESIARETFGFSGAHLEAVVNEAAIAALRAGRDRLEQADLREAVDKVMLGERLDRRPPAEEMHRVAVHEAGHALVSERLMPGSVAQVTVTSRGQALGYVRQAEQEDRHLYTARQLEDRIAVALAGAVAEDLVLGGRSTGAMNDFEKATELARQMVYAGMSPLGVVSKDHVPGDSLHQAVAGILSAQESRVRELLSESRPVLTQAAERLADVERLSGDELRAWLREVTEATPSKTA
ncbi:AAA family ATPase [Carboxydochorda subterranea]|uniref:AAA family ATPase n=1 Tax=Carboxydichorda subterranea TaxID=3109565 RepID=A0ABZ1C173_9FIRM|nr:AAA family ATPase [Limnochorda sp. L945t]WRP18585.1 AAA family ATPase [Limnochorda sp. L945t]